MCKAPSGPLGLLEKLRLEKSVFMQKEVSGELKMGPTRVRLSAPDENGVQIMEHLEATPIEDGHLGGQMMQLMPVKPKRESGGARRASTPSRAGRSW